MARYLKMQTIVCTRDALNLINTRGNHIAKGFLKRQLQLEVRIRPAHHYAIELQIGISGTNEIGTLTLNE